MEQDMPSNDSCWITTFVFISGFILGAGAAFLMTPEPGTNIRNRLAKGAKIAQKNLGMLPMRPKKHFTQSPETHSAPSSKPLRVSLTPSKPQKKPSPLLMTPHLLPHSNPQTQAKVRLIEHCSNSNYFLKMSLIRLLKPY